MNLAIFDLDNTLLAGDSDYAWGEFLIEQGIVDAEFYKKENDRFYEEYKSKTLDILEYQRFVFTPLMAMDKATRGALHQRFMETTIAPLMQKKAATLIEQHKAQGDTLLVITATNRFITAPIVERLGIDHLLATEPEIINEQFTGNVVGEPCFQEGKIVRLKQWLAQRNKEINEEFVETSFYSDSINDAPLLAFVDNPFAVDPDDALRTLAEENHWPIISLRD